MKYLNQLSGKRIWALIAALALIIAVFSCGPKPPKEKKAVNAPFNLKAIAGDRIATLSWQIDRPNNTPIGGYNIYLSQSPDDAYELYNSGPYPGDTDGDISHESIVLPRLENGIRYYAYLKTVLSDNSLSQASGTVSFMPLAQGYIDLTQNYTVIKSGYNFAAGKYTKVRDSDNDIYIYATKDRAGISSPSRMHASLRQTLISVDGSPFELTQQFIKGKVYTLETADGGLVKLTLLKWMGESPAVEATFDYIYYPPGVRP